MNSPDQDATTPSQRVAAYGICVREGDILLTRLSANTGRPGAWTLPGGGIDHGEHPRDAAIREAHEETGLHVEVHQVLFVDSAHYTGQSPEGSPHDHHAIRIVYVMTTADVSPPLVLDVGGSTDAAAWVPLAAIDEYPVVELVTLALGEAGFTLV